MIFISNYFLIKQGSNYYTINSNHYDTTNKIYTALTLTGGTQPNISDYENFGFTDVYLLTQNTIISGETFKPIDKFGEIKVIGVTFTTTDNLTFTVNPTTNKPFKKNSIICYNNGTIVTPSNIDYTNGTVTFGSTQTETMTFDYTYIIPFDVKLYKSV